MVHLGPRSQKILLGASAVVVGTLLVLGGAHQGSLLSASLKRLVESDEFSGGRTQTVLADVGLTSGWATFGQALPQGAARDALQIGDLETQTDVKTRWPDGSIRFAPEADYFG
ncbi:MAG: hypothetical protein Q8R32_01415, partial [bacterium]|nr:hypothetical protein [bacterium]